jgi:hypothetical protein
LAELALHFWRPNFTPTQVKHLLADFLEDLEDYTPAEVAEACKIYRCNSENRWFPTPGMLLAILKRYEMSKPKGIAAQPNTNLQIDYARGPFKSVAEILKAAEHKKKHKTFHEQEEAEEGSAAQGDA